MISFFFLHKMSHLNDFHRVAHPTSTIDNELKFIYPSIDIYCNFGKMNYHKCALILLFLPFVNDRNGKFLSSFMPIVNCSMLESMDVDFFKTQSGNHDLQNLSVQETIERGLRRGWFMLRVLCTYKKREWKIIKSWNKKFHPHSL